jgi:hypothetical protein
METGAFWRPFPFAVFYHHFEYTLLLSPIGTTGTHFDRLMSLIIGPAVGAFRDRKGI